MSATTENKISTTVVILNNVPASVLQSKSHVRTAEDDAKDLAEANWKEQRNREAVQSLLRRYPNGRAPV